MSVAYFVVGTDTGIGKTHATCALLHALARRHARVCGMKPDRKSVVSSAASAPSARWRAVSSSRTYGGIA